ncbi:hypothetical protein [Bacillus cereus]|uniref:hypothetical protein n=1 Tax=Bacillus cereus TaxID=1396 RepID=UPI000BF9C2D7|nr:hypothetical protein [Bacillus cereus]PEQ63656.1 hypothetical protein CN469_14640 [Bacillus cereus]
MANNKLIVEVSADTTEAAKECVDALEKLERVMKKSDPVEVKVNLLLNGKLIAESIAKQTTGGFRSTVSTIKQTSDSIVQRINSDTSGIRI